MLGVLKFGFTRRPEELVHWSETRLASGLGRAASRPHGGGMVVRGPPCWVRSVHARMQAHGLVSRRGSRRRYSHQGTGGGGLRLQLLIQGELLAVFDPGDYRAYPPPLGEGGGTRIREAMTL